MLQIQSDDPIRKVRDAQAALRHIEANLPGVTLSLRFDRGWVLAAHGPAGTTRTRLASPFRYRALLAIGQRVAMDSLHKPVVRLAPENLGGDAA